MRNLSSAPDAARSDIPDAAALDACLANIAEKNTAALEELYRGTSASVYGFALSILKNAPDAQDVMHDCYVSIYSAAAGYRSSGKPMAWILTIVRNLCLRKLRESRKTADLPPEEWERVLEEREEVEPEDKLVLSACMRLLSDEERQIVTLHAVSGFKHREIAQMLGAPMPTVLSKYSRALKKLKHALLKGERQNAEQRAGRETPAGL